MEGGFYNWYEGVFNGVVSHGDTLFNSAVSASYEQTIASLFTGKLSSPMVVIRMQRDYDFALPGAWPRSFKAFLYRQQNYHQIMHDLYGDYMHPKLLTEHRNLVSYLEGQSFRSHTSASRLLGSKLDLCLRVILPTSTKLCLSLQDVFLGVFLWKRTYMLLLGEDTLSSLKRGGISAETVDERRLPLPFGSIWLKVIRVKFMEESRLVPLLPDLAEIETPSEGLLYLTNEVGRVLSSLAMNYASYKLANQLNIP